MGFLWSLGLCSISCRYCDHYFVHHQHWLVLTAFLSTLSSVTTVCQRILELGILSLTLTVLIPSICHLHFENRPLQVHASLYFSPILLRRAVMVMLDYYCYILIVASDQMDCIDGCQLIQDLDCGLFDPHLHYWICQCCLVWCLMAYFKTYFSDCCLCLTVSRIYSLVWFEFHQGRLYGRLVGYSLVIFGNQTYYFSVNYLNCSINFSQQEILYSAPYKVIHMIHLYLTSLAARSVSSAWAFPCFCKWCQASLTSVPNHSRASLFSHELFSPPRSKRQYLRKRSPNLCDSLSSSFWTQLSAPPAQYLLLPIVASTPQHPRYP